MQGGIAVLVAGTALAIGAGILLSKQGQAAAVDFPAGTIIDFYTPVGTPLYTWHILSVVDADTRLVAESAFPGQTFTLTVQEIQDTINQFMVSGAQVIVTKPGAGSLFLQAA